MFADKEQSRLRIEVSDTGKQGGAYDWKFQKMDYGIVREICLRLAMYFRLQAIYGDALQTICVTIGEKIYPIIIVEQHRILTDVRSICVVYDPPTQALQVSLNTLTPLEATVALEDIAHIISAMRFPENVVSEN